MTTTPRDPYRPKCEGDPSRAEEMRHTNPMRPENNQPTRSTDSGTPKSGQSGQGETDPKGIKRADSSSIPEGMKPAGGGLAAASMSGGGGKSDADPRRPDSPRDTQAHPHTARPHEESGPSDPFRPDDPTRTRPSSFEGERHMGQGHPEGMHNKPSTGPENPQASDPMDAERRRSFDPMRPELPGSTDSGNRENREKWSAKESSGHEHESGGKSEAQRKSEEVAESSKRAAGEFAETAKDRMREYAEAGKERGAERIGGVARAIHGAADSLEKESPVAASYIHQAAESIDNVSQALSRRSVDDLVGTVQDYGRRNPAMLFGGALVAGVFLARFIKSSSDRADGERHREPGRHGAYPTDRPPERYAGGVPHSESGQSGRKGGSAPAGQGR